VAQADLDTLGDPLDPAFDVVVVPGLVDLHRAATDPDLHTAVRRATAGAGIVASVCTGSVLLAHVGLLDDAALATTHHEDVEALAALLGDGRATVARWVDAGDVVTAGGLSSGLAMALHLVDRLVSRDLAVRTAAQIAYDWDPDAGVTA
jgi:transcriptional regulator GlxA family with amidase domain